MGTAGCQNFLGDVEGFFHLVKASDGSPFLEGCRHHWIVKNIGCGQGHMAEYKPSYGEMQAREPTVPCCFASAQELDEVPVGERGRGYLRGLVRRPACKTRHSLPRSRLREWVRQKNQPSSRSRRSGWAVHQPPTGFDSGGTPG